MAQQRSTLPRLSIPPRPPSFQTPHSVSHTARVYHPFTPSTSKSSFLVSPTLTPTTSKSSRAPQGPLWLFTLLHLISFYLLYRWLSTTAFSPPLSHLAFVSVLIAACCLNTIYRPWTGRRILFSQWGLLFVSGTLLALSYLLRFEGLQSAGPLETILAEFAGFLVTKVLLDSPYKGSETAKMARGLVALLLGILFLSHGWARVSCSPLAIDVSHRTRIMLIEQPADCLKISSMLAPILGGVFLAFHKMTGARTALKSIGRKRIQVISYAMGSLALFPVAMLQAATGLAQNRLQFGISFWFAGGTTAFGMILAVFNEFYAEDKLQLQVHSFTMFRILACCICGLELLFGSGISLVGFSFCCIVLGFGVQELCLIHGQSPWDELRVTANRSYVFASWIRRPLQHIFQDKKSRKIAIFLLINTGFMVVEFFYGFLRNSLGLISDACHMLFDCAALAIGLYASYISRLPENAKFNYGYGRFEVVSGYANAVLLVLVASLIVLESIERILEPPEISTESLLVVSVGGLLVNIVGLIFFHEEHHHAHAHSGHSCSHSHSNKKSLHGHESTWNDGQMVLSTTSSDGSDSQFHKQVQPSAGHDNRACSSSFTESMNILHSAQQGDRDHSDHVCQSHNPHNLLPDSGGRILNLDLSSESKHGSQHHGPYQDGKDGAYSIAHSHTCSGVHAGHSSEEHDFEGNIHRHVDENNDLMCDHSHGHAVSQIQLDVQDGHGYYHQNDDLSDVHSHHHHHGSDGLSHKHGHEHHHLDHSHAHMDDCHQNHGHSHHHHMDHNMYGIFLHVLADTLGSVGVVISTLLIKYKGWLITDPACSIILSVLIIGSVIPLLRNSAEILLQRAPRYTEQSFSEAINKIKQLNGVHSLGRVHLWSFTNTQVVGSLHVQLIPGCNRQKVQNKSLKILREAGIKDLTLQVEEISWSSLDKTAERC